MHAARARPPGLDFIRGAGRVGVARMTFERGGTVRSVEVRPSEAGWTATVREGDRVMANMTFMDPDEKEVVASLTRSMESSGFRRVGG